ncbi:MAG TPA: G5 domain-containing protein [Anaerolineae bacterium]|nr:G5 domain-containing protein [Anaerolineae bacterium]HQH37213.1 G5 domain-containing protein [Anaerolineae bacterium]
MSPFTFPKAKYHRLYRVVLVALWTLLAACGSPPPLEPNRVTLVVDGEQRIIVTALDTVRDLLTAEGVTLGELDRVTPPETAALRQGMTITVVRVVQRTETLTETIPFGRQVVRDATVPEGEVRLLQAGQAGVLERAYRLTFEDGVEIERTLMQEAVTQPPQDEIRLVGTRPQVETVIITGTLAYLNNQDAWILRGSNRARRRVTTLGDLDGRVFSLSPDASKLLFTRAVTNAEHINELWLIRTAEADPNPVPLNVSDVLWAGWHPDGKSIAWTTAEIIEPAPGWRGQNDLWTAQLTAQFTLVTRRKILVAEAGGGYGWWGTRYAWSPDGAALAYSQPDSVGVVNLRQAERVPLLTFPPYRTYSSWAWNPAVAWSPDGNFIATVVHAPSPNIDDPEESPIFDVWQIAVTGAYSAELAAETGMWATPVYAPAGNTLLFGRALVPYQSDISPHKLCLIDRDGSNAFCFDTPGETGIELPVWRWSPDRQQIAFIYLNNIDLLAPQDGSVIPLVDDGGITLLDWR